ncbi:CCN family member 1-like [Haliotis rubra]|uniref:CCN family member 1-like n=1 Tax=Haliotis rubra TaxID=36100 RepID=UPI001EE4F33F|nr:CCN family member 1-like [Haliotis rubra]
MVGKIALILVAVATVTYAASVNVVRQTTGCYYKTVIYQQGEQWLDGCDYTCKCIDASIGEYQCNTVCLPLNLPPQCQLLDAPQGKCCKVPQCPYGFQINNPDGFQINYPDGYVPR